MTPTDLGNDTSSANRPVPSWIGRPKPLGRRLIRRLLQDAAHLGGNGGRDELRLRLKIAAHHGIDSDRKIVGPESCEARAQTHHGGVLRRSRAVAADVRGGKREVLVNLLAGLNLQRERFPILVELTAG